MLRDSSLSVEPGMIGILRRTGFQITNSRSQTLDFGWDYSKLVCVGVCVSLIKTEK